MPIQNVGTLLENMVVTETAALLLDRIGCLRYRSDRGPNGALLVSLVATLRRADLNLWANDIVDGHYGNAIPSLVGIAEVVQEILPEFSPSIHVNVCDAPFPSSLDNLRTTLDGWGPNVGAVMGFVDPMRYVRDSRLGPYTRSTDHRRWLALLNNWGPSLAVHFTGNSDSASLLTELDALREDLKQSGFPFWLEIRRQHYVVSVGSPGIEALDALELRARTSWAAWCERVPEIKSRKLDISRR